MRSAFFPTLAILVLLQALPSVARADLTPLNIGDPAPALSMSKWIKGEPVTKFEKGKIYVVEFWATWCGPCRASIPHLSKLQEEHKDVIFIGQNCWEEDQAGVPAFVKEMGDKMNYRVALDDMTHTKRGSMGTAWMDAAAQNGIPTAFVVDKETKIAWIGHPMALDDVLKGVEAGTFDGKKMAAQQEAIEKITASIRTAIAAKEFDKAIASLDELAKLQPEMADRLQGGKFDFLLMKQDYPAAWALGEKLVVTFKDNSDALNSLAWMIVDPKGPVKAPNLDLALKMSLRANELTKDENSSNLDTLARIYFLKADLDKAIETQTKAVDKGSAEEKPGLAKDLEAYKAAKAKK